MLIDSCILDEHVGARPAGSEPGGDPRPPTIRHCLVPLEPRAPQPRTADAAPGGGLREPLQARRLAHLGGCWGGPRSRKPSSPASPVTLAGPLDLSGPPCPDLGHRAVSSTWPTGAPRGGSQGTRAQPQASPDTQRGLCAVCTAVEPLGFHEAQFGKHSPNEGWRWPPWSRAWRCGQVAPMSPRDLARPAPQASAAFPGLPGGTGKSRPFPQHGRPPRAGRSLFCRRPVLGPEREGLRALSSGIVWSSSKGKEFALGRPDPWERHLSWGPCRGPAGPGGAPDVRRSGLRPEGPAHPSTLSPVAPPLLWPACGPGRGDCPWRGAP